MEIIDKAEIIVQFVQDNYEEDQYEEFFKYNDMGVPLSIAVSNGLVILTEEGINLLEETWIDLCNELGADPNEEYESIDDLF